VGNGGHCKSSDFFLGGGGGEMKIINWVKNFLYTTE
jgi:hypothetical protein